MQLTDRERWIKEKLAFKSPFIAECPRINIRSLKANGSASTPTTSTATPALPSFHNDPNFPTFKKNAQVGTKKVLLSQQEGGVKVVYC